jgi:hypothetical protein
MSFLSTICIILGVTVVASSLIGVCFRLLRWRLLALGAYSLGILFVVVRPEAWWNMSAAQGGAMAMLIMLLAPVYVVAVVLGMGFADFLRKRMVSKKDSSNDA